MAKNQHGKQGDKANNTDVPADSKNTSVGENNTSDSTKDQGNSTENEGGSKDNVSGEINTEATTDANASTDTVNATAGTDTVNDPAPADANASDTNSSDAAAPTDSATDDTTLDATTTTDSETSPAAETKPEPPKQMTVLAESIERLFSERAATNLPKLIESQVKEHTANAARGIDIQYHYTNDEKTAGFIVLKEFEHEIRVPAEGELEFGVDYSKGR